MTYITDNDDNELMFLCFQVVDACETFDSSVIQQVKEDEEARLFANVVHFKAGRFFLKTKFHGEFVNIIRKIRQSEIFWNYVSGIQGLGKTSSVLYYVLECRSKKDDKIHYIDLNEIERWDENLEKFGAFSGKLKKGGSLVIDHVTLFNDHYLKKIKRIVESKVDRFILIETGFTASAHTACLDCGKEFQLDKENFMKIWNGTLQSKGCQDKELSAKGEQVYKMFSVRFIMTPRLLHHVLEIMYAFHGIGKTVVGALGKYTRERQNAILSDYKGCGDTELLAKFRLHTSTLLHYIPDEGEYIFTEKQAKEMMIAINIFDMEYCIVTKDCLLKNVELLELDLNEGDVYVKVCHLVPFLTNDWRNRFPFKLEEVLEKADEDKIFAVMFQNGGARKEFVERFVESQEKQGYVILPPTNILGTSYMPAETKMDVPQTKCIIQKSLTIPPQNFFKPRLSMDSFLKDMPENLKGHKKNVGMVALYMKQLVASTETFLVYPQIENCMGFDYFVYCMNENEACSPSKIPKSKENSTLYLFQVATGATRRGDTIGQALNVVKGVFSDENVTVHAVVVVAQCDQEPYTLTKCRFDNISVLNMYEKTAGIIQKTLQSDRLLYNMYLQLVHQKTTE